MAPGSGFNPAFNDAFTVDEITYVTVDVGPVRVNDTPEHPPYSPLWRRFAYPVAQQALLLFKDGRVVLSDSLYTSDYLHADDVIKGGYVWFTTSDSWQADVLRAAGYTLKPYEGDVPWPR